MKNLKVPNHLAVIVDGNRRWARKRGLLPWEGHKYGAKKVEKLLEWCLELGVQHLSVYVLSTENIEKRPKREVQELFRLFKEYIKRLEKDNFSLLEKYEVRVKFVGDLKRLPSSLVKLAERVMKKTSKFNKRFFNVLIAYGSHFEITQAFRKLAQKLIESGRIEITPKDIEQNLLVPVPVDLIIRTGGYHRLSNFLLWQASYAELYVTQTLWPDFTKEELIKAIEWYSNVERHFGR